MSDLTRFGVSVEKDLLEKFDSHIAKKKYNSRSKALMDLIRKELLDEKWILGKKVVGTINVVYDHHKRELSTKLTKIQHEFHAMIISTQHIHLNHHDCFEIIVVKGSPAKVRDLASRLESAKGVKHTSLSVSSLEDQR